MGLGRQLVRGLGAAVSKGSGLWGWQLARSLGAAVSKGSGGCR